MQWLISSFKMSVNNGLNGLHGSPRKRARTEPEHKAVVVLGAQWGDEGKGKVVDMLAENVDIVCRCQVLFINCIVLIAVTKPITFNSKVTIRSSIKLISILKRDYVKRQL